MFENLREKNRKEDRQIKRADMYLIAFFLLLALGSLIWFVVNRKEGRALRISYDGQRIADVSLSQVSGQKMAGEDNGETCYCLLLYAEENVSYQWYGARPDLGSLVSGKDGYNLLAVSGDRVWMEAADCRDQICVHHRPITGGGESIICLPHKLAVEMVGGTDSETLDGIAKAKGAGEAVPEERRRGHETDG